MRAMRRWVLVWCLCRGRVNHNCVWCMGWRGGEGDETVGACLVLVSWACEPQLCVVYGVAWGWGRLRSVCDGEAVSAPSAHLGCARPIFVLCTQLYRVGVCVPLALLLPVLRCVLACLACRCLMVRVSHCGAPLARHGSSPQRLAAVSSLVGHPLQVGATLQEQVRL